MLKTVRCVEDDDDLETGEILLLVNRDFDRIVDDCEPVVQSGAGRAHLHDGARGARPAPGDHAARPGDRPPRARADIEGFRDLLSSALLANLTQAAVRQNEDMRKISAWVAILAVPTGVAAIYGTSRACPSCNGASGIRSCWR